MKKTLKVSRKFQIVIPKEIRDLLGIMVNDNICFAYENGRAYIYKPRNNLNKWLGKVKSKQRLK